MPKKVQVPKATEQAFVAELAAQAAVMRAQRDAASKLYAEALGSTPDEAEAKRLRIRERIEDYGEFVYGYKPEPHHQIWVNLLYQLMAGTLPGGKKKLLILAPPGTAKSSWVTQIFTTWMLGRDPSLNVFFATSSDDNALIFGGALRDVLETNERHALVFPEPECRPNRKRGWSSNGYYLKGALPRKKDPSLRAVGLGAKVPGPRVDLMVLDDPLDQMASESVVEQKTAAAYYDKTLNTRLLPGTGRAVAIMTRWHENDFAAHLISRSDWYVVKCPMTAEDPSDDPKEPIDPTLKCYGGYREKGDLLWPDRFTPEYLADELESLGLAQYNCIYQCSILGLGGDVYRDVAWFKPLPEDFNVPDATGRTLASRLYRISAWDLAYSGRDTAAYTVGGIIGVDLKTRDLYLLHVHRDHMTALQVEQAIVAQCRDWRPHVLAVEDAAFRTRETKLILHNVQQRVIIRIRLLKPIADKIARARLPAARAEAGKFFVDLKAPWWEKCRNELMGFPKTVYKDQVDMVSLGAEAAQEVIDDSKQDQKPRPVSVTPTRTKRRRRMFMAILG